MCFTVNVNLVKEELENIYGRDFIDHERYRPSYYYHAFSLPELPVVRAGRIQLMRWGLIPQWVRDTADANEIRVKTFNARSETVDSKPSFSDSFRTRRCIVPVSGFYEWQHTSSGKLPWYIRPSSSTHFSLGGLWSEWVTADTGETISTFSIITTEANSLMSKIHNSGRRMPLIINDSLLEKWLNPETVAIELQGIMVPYPEEGISAHTIGPLISDRKRDRNNPELIKPYTYNISGTLFD